MAPPPAVSDIGDRHILGRGYENGHNINVTTICDPDRPDWLRLSSSGPDGRLAQTYSWDDEGLSQHLRAALVAGFLVAGLALLFAVGLIGAVGSPVAAHERRGERAERV